MKVLSEKDILTLTAQSKEVLSEAGVKIAPFKYPRANKETGKQGDKGNWLKGYIASIIETMQAASHERRVLNALVGVIAKAITDAGSRKALAEPPRRWAFSIVRDERGFIKEIEATRKE